MKFDADSWLLDYCDEAEEIDSMWALFRLLDHTAPTDHAREWVWLYLASLRDRHHWGSSASDLPGEMEARSYYAAHVAPLLASLHTDQRATLDSSIATFKRQACEIVHMRRKPTVTVVSGSRRLWYGEASSEP